MTVVLESITIPENIFKSHATTNMSRSPDRGSIQRAAANALQTRSVDVDRMHGTLFRTFRLQPATNSFYILRCRPSSSIRLLRHEEDGLQTEVLTLQALRGRSGLIVSRLIDAHSTTAVIGSPYLVAGPFKGSILSEVESQLSKNALASIDKSLGSLAKRLTYVSGTYFGPVGQPSAGTQSWSRCFAGMLESLLRDAEDALISLPYDSIRNHVRRHRQSLDGITQPKLLLMELVNDHNILVDSRTHSVSGLTDFSSAMYGDPYLSNCFYRPSLAFVDGFGKLPNSTTDERIRQYL